MVYMLISQGCCNKLPQSWWLKQQKLAISALKAGNLELMSQQGCTYSESLGRNCLPSSTFWWLLVVHGQQQQSSDLPPSSHHLLLCMCFISLCLSKIATLMMVSQDPPRQSRIISRSFTQSNLVTFIKFLPYEVIYTVQNQDLLSLGSHLPTTMNVAFQITRKGIYYSINIVGIINCLFGEKKCFILSQYKDGSKIKC